MKNAELIESLRDAIKLNYFVIQELEDTTVKINDDRGNTTITLPSKESTTTSRVLRVRGDNTSSIFDLDLTPKPKKIEKLEPTNIYDRVLVNKLKEIVDAINEIRGSK